MNTVEHILAITGGITVVLVIGVFIAFVCLHKGLFGNWRFWEK